MKFYNGKIYCEFNTIINLDSINENNKKEIEKAMNTDNFKMLNLIINNKNTNEKKTMKIVKSKIIAMEFVEIEGEK